MSWNYRLCQYTLDGQTRFGIREVYYESDGVARGWTEASVNDWTSPDEVRGTLDLMRGAFEKPVLRIPLQDATAPPRRPRQARPVKKTGARKKATPKSAVKAARRGR